MNICIIEEIGEIITVRVAMAGKHVAQHAILLFT